MKLKPKLSERNEGILRRFIVDMRASLAETERVLDSEGKAIYVVGENMIKGTFVRNADLVTAVAGLVGLQLIDRKARTLPASRRYLPPPAARGEKAALDVRMRREVVLAFRR
jgi:hypothetical protein